MIDDYEDERNNIETIRNHFSGRRTRQVPSNWNLLQMVERSHFSNARCFQVYYGREYQLQAMMDTPSEKYGLRVLSLHFLGMSMGRVRKLYGGFLL